MALGIGVLVWLPVSAQSPRPTFRAGISRVTLNVIVKDSHGRALTDLADTDFQIFDQGLAVPLSDFRVGEEPVSVALLIDTSGSMRIGTRLATARQAADMLLAHLRDGDEAALFTFDRTLHEIAPFSQDLTGVRQGFDRVNPFGSTALHDAVAATARRSVARASFRGAVVAITDGFDNSSELTAAAASNIASAIDVPVYVMAVANTSDPVHAGDAAFEPVESGVIARLDDLTRWTGGALLAAETPAQTSLAVRQIISDLRTGYVMAFAPQTAPGWHQLTVRVARKGATVRTRSGFWMADSSASRQ